MGTWKKGEDKGRRLINPYLSGGDSDRDLSTVGTHNLAECLQDTAHHIQPAIFSHRSCKKHSVRKS